MCKGEQWREFWKFECSRHLQAHTNQLPVPGPPPFIPHPDLATARSPSAQSGLFYAHAPRLSPAPWCSSVQLLHICIYKAPTSAIWLIAILCFAGQLSMQWQHKQAVALKYTIQFKYVTSCTDSEENSTRTLFRCRVCSSIVPEPCSGAGYVVQYSWYWTGIYTVSHAIDLHTH